MATSKNHKILFEPNFWPNTAKITLNSPQTSNALDDEMIESLVDHLKMIERDSKIRLLLLSAQGKAFCAGGDIKAMQKREGMFAGNPMELANNYRNGIQEIPRAFDRLEIPTVAVVEGSAVGAGVDLSCMCDIRLAGPKASFRESFGRLNLIPGDGGAFFLHQVVGPGRATEMILTGRTYNAQKALTIGLVSEIFPEETLWNDVKTFCQDILNNGPSSMRLVKKILRSLRVADLNAHLDLISLAQGLAQTHDHHVEGLASMNEKRTPQYK